MSIAILLTTLYVREGYSHAKIRKRMQITDIFD